MISHDEDIKRDGLSKVVHYIKEAVVSLIHTHQD
jgi:hypothetical protein